MRTGPVRPAIINPERPQCGAKGWWLLRPVTETVVPETFYAASWSDGNRTGLWLYFVSIAEADANEPIDHQREWQKGEYGQKDGAAQESGKDLLLAEEEGACSEEESETHAP
jgi:hypothetical protein